jgi:hypothetical protein
VAQGVGPEFKPSTAKERRERERESKFKNEILLSCRKKNVFLHK